MSIITDSKLLFNPELEHASKAGFTEINHRWRVFEGSMTDFKDTVTHHYPKATFDMVFCAERGDRKSKCKASNARGFRIGEYDKATNLFCLKVAR